MNTYVFIKFTLVPKFYKNTHHYFSPVFPICHALATKIKIQYLHITHKCSMFFFYVYLRLFLIRHAFILILLQKYYISIIQY